MSIGEPIESVGHFSDIGLGFVKTIESIDRQLRDRGCDISIEACVVRGRQVVRAFDRNSDTAGMIPLESVPFVSASSTACGSP